MLKRRLFLGLNFILICAFSSALIIFPKETAEAARNAISICAVSVIPSLFPFFFVSRLMTGLGFPHMLGKFLSPAMFPAFKLSGTGSSALILGLLGGYPVGAATVSELYESKLLSKEESEHLLAFCNNAGPAFIIGAVGAGVFASAKVGISLFIIHVLSAISVGLILRHFAPKTSANRAVGHAEKSFSSVFTSSVSGALSSSLAISAYIILFSVIAKMLELFYISPFFSDVLFSFFKIPKPISEAFLKGLFEITSGLFGLSAYKDVNKAFILSAFLLGFGGMSVHFQTLGVIEKSGLSPKKYFLGKLMQGFFGALYAFAASFFVSFDIEASSHITYQPRNAEGIFVGFIIFLTIIFLFCKKGWKIAKK